VLRELRRDGLFIDEKIFQIHSGSSDCPVTHFPDPFSIVLFLSSL
jgi:NADPH-dependent 7-cyano-7-deazaguanine reductase QueF